MSLFDASLVARNFTLICAVILSIQENESVAIAANFTELVKNALGVAYAD